MNPNSRSLLSRLFAWRSSPSPEIVDYLEWSLRNESTPAPSAEQAVPSAEQRLAELAASNELCRREQALLDELATLDVSRAVDSAESESSAVNGASLNLATVEATLKRLRAQNSVVALRPGTAPPSPRTANSHTQQHRAPALSMGVRFLALATAVATFALVFWGLDYSSSNNNGSNNGASHPLENAKTSSVEARGAAVSESTALHDDSAASNERVARLALFSGSVRVDGQLQLVAGQELRAGSVVEVLSGRACLALPRAIAACLEQNSEVVVPPLGAELGLQVRRGRVAAQLAKQAPGNSFSLFARDTRALAVGTLFGLHAHANGEVSVQVMEGRVQVVLDAAAQPSNRHELSAGQRIDSGAAQIQTSPADSDAPYLALLAGQNMWGVASGTAQPHAVLYVESEPPGAFVRYDAEELGVTPLSVMVPWGEAASPTAGVEHTVALQLAGHESSERHFALDKGGVHRLFFQLESSAAVASNPAQRVPEAAAAGASQAVDASSLLSRARQLVREGRWLEAANTYRALRAAYPGSSEAKTVLVALGQLELDRLAQPRAAQSSFQAYLDSGAGALSQEARAGKIRALRAQGQRAAELSAIREYLALHPSGLDTTTLERRARELESR